MIENYYSVLSQQNAYAFAFAVFCLVAVVCGICAFVSTRKSRQYRKEIVDMYVASKTKKLAKDEGLDIVEEYESFKKWSRKKRLETSVKELDDFIEDDLKEKLSEKVSKKVPERNAKDKQ